MTAPAKPPMLPPCPIPGCGRRPIIDPSFGGKVACEDAADHVIKVYGRTQAVADARWRRLAGGWAK